MIKSMTGYGKAELTIDSGKITIEIKTLNSKNADINIKSYILPKEEELHIRQYLIERLQRGTIELYIGYEASGNTNEVKRINETTVCEYYRQLVTIKSNLEGKVSTNYGVDNYLLSCVLRMPDVIEQNKTEIINAHNRDTIQKGLEEAVEMVNQYRIDEGKALYNDLKLKLNTILELSKDIEKYEQERKENVRAKLTKALNDLSQQVDPGRFEQEMLFYLDKLDINEEKVRLRQHCDYFLNSLENDTNQGKKLGFIVQEIGRELNTTGSKANHIGIQSLVVKMKGLLDQVREQSLNVL